MIHANGSEKAKSGTRQTKNYRKIFPNILRNPTTWFISGATALAGAGLGYVINEGLEARGRSTDIKVAARAWANGNPNAFKGLSRVSISQLQSTDNAPKMIAQTIIESKLAGSKVAPSKDRAAYICATAVLSNKTNKDLFTPEQMTTIRDGLEANAPVATSDAALTICNAEIVGEDSLVYPVGVRGKAATVAWQKSVGESNYIIQLP